MEDVKNRCYDLWCHENTIVNQKIMAYFAITSLLTVAMQRLTLHLLIAAIGVIVSIVWFFWIGRTIVYRNHWRSRATASNITGSDLFP